MNTRHLYYGVGAIAMAGLLAAAIFGSVGHLFDPYAARGSLVGTFLLMRYQHHVCRALVMWQVAAASLLSGLFAAGLGRALWHGPITGFWTEAGESMAAALVATAMMIVSFYGLTLGRGRMP